MAFEKAPGLDITKATGAYPLDVDGDGNIDLAILRLGENHLMRGRGDCTFEKANRAWNYDGGRAWTTGFSATWEAGAPFPTLAFVNYIDRTAPGSPWGTCEANVLARPGKGDAPNYANPQLLDPGHCALSALFTDWNNSGEPALRITNDRQYYRGGEEQLWRVPPDRPARPYRSADGWQRLQIWGMGIAEHDLNGDGRPAYALTSMGDTKLQVLDDEAEEDRPVYRDTAFDKGATAHRPYTGEDGKPSTGWHAQFADFNNDARTDLFIAKGNVEAMPDFAAFDPDNLLLGTLDGAFHEAGNAVGHCQAHTWPRGGGGGFQRRRNARSAGRQPWRACQPVPQSWPENRLRSCADGQLVEGRIARCRRKSVWRRSPHFGEDRQPDAE